MQYNQPSPHLDASQDGSQQRCLRSVPSSYQLLMKASVHPSRSLTFGGIFTTFTPALSAAYKTRRKVTPGKAVSCGLAIRSCGPDGVLSTTAKFDTKPSIRSPSGVAMRTCKTASGGGNNAKARRNGCSWLTAARLEYENLTFIRC